MVSLQLAEQVAWVKHINRPVHTNSNYEMHSMRILKMRIKFELILSTRNTHNINKSNY